MTPVVSYTAYCQYCVAHFTEKSQALAEASRNAHEDVCNKNPDVVIDKKFKGETL